MVSIIIPTSAALHLAKKITGPDFKVVLPDLNREKKRRFPDGEVYVRLSKIKEIKNNRVIVLHAGAAEPNDGLVELELILQILKDNHIRPKIFFSYFPYSRQDMIFEEGETNVAENLILKFIGYYGVRNIYAIEPHFAEREWVKKYPLSSISAAPFLIDKVKKDFGEDVIFLATDKGGQRRLGIAGFDKVRENSYVVKLKLREDLINSLKGKVVCLVDDLVETGGTLFKAADLSKKYGAKKIVCAITHGLLKEGVEKTKKKFDKVYLTNTIYQPKFPQINITQLILKAINAHS